MVQSKEERIQLADETQYYAWLITDEEYGNLREIPGCEILKNLGATKTDVVHILKMFKYMRIPKENIFQNHGATDAELK